MAAYRRPSDLSPRCWARHGLCVAVFSLVFICQATQCWATAEVQRSRGAFSSSKSLPQVTLEKGPRLRTRELLQKQLGYFALPRARPVGRVPVYFMLGFTAFLPTFFALGCFPLSDVRALHQKEHTSLNSGRLREALSRTPHSSRRYSVPGETTPGWPVCRQGPARSSAELPQAAARRPLSRYGSEGYQRELRGQVTGGRPTADYRHSDGCSQESSGGGQLEPSQAGKNPAAVSPSAGLRSPLETDKVILGEKRARLTLTLSNNQVHGCIVDNRTQRTYAYASSFDACLRAEIGSVQRKRGECRHSSCRN